MGRRRYNIKPRFFIMLIVITVSIGLYYYFQDRQENIVKSKSNNVIMKNYLLVDRNNLYYIYEKLVFKLPKDLYFTKKKNLKIMIEKKNYKEIVNSSNYILPEKLEGYKYGKYEKLGDVDLLDLPLIKSKNKIYIKSSSLNEIFVNDYYKISSEKKNVVIDVLNANGINGYASKTGNKIKKRFSYEYTAANYDSISEYSYIIENRLSRNNIKKIVTLLDEKYIKIKKDSSVPSMSDAVIVIGNEKVKDFKIKLTANSLKSLEYDSLKKNDYKNIKRYKSETRVKENEIRHNGEDYYIAYKISKILKINNLIEDNSLINTVDIKVGGN